MKIIGRISKKGNKYYQTAVNKEGEETKWISVFLKKGLENFEMISLEKKVDKKGVMYELIEIPDKNVFKPAPDETGFEKYIITK